MAKLLQRISLEPSSLGVEQRTAPKAGRGCSRHAVQLGGVFPVHNPWVARFLSGVFASLLCLWHLPLNVLLSFCCYFRSAESTSNLVLIISFRGFCILVGSSENRASGMSWNVMGSWVLAATQRCNWFRGNLSSRLILPVFFQFPI